MCDEVLRLLCIYLQSESLYKMANWTFHFFFVFLPPLGAAEPRVDLLPDVPLDAGSGVLSDRLARGRRAFFPVTERHQFQEHGCHNTANHVGVKFYLLQVPALMHSIPL